MTTEYTCIYVYLQILNTELNHFNTKRPQILGFQPVFLASANQCVCPGGHIWLCYQFIYCIYLLAQAGFWMQQLHSYTASCNSAAYNSEKIAIKNLKSRFQSFRIGRWKEKVWNSKKQCSIRQSRICQYIFLYICT